MCPGPGRCGEAGPAAAGPVGWGRKRPFLPALTRPQTLLGRGSTGPGLHFEVTLATVWGGSLGRAWRSSEAAAAVTQARGDSGLGQGVAVDVNKNSLDMVINIRM